MPLTFTKEGTLRERKEIWKRREDCRTCHEAKLVEVLDLGLQYLTRFPLTTDFTLPKAPLVLARCSACGLLQLRDTVDPDQMFREYWYRSTINATMRLALVDLVNHGSTYKRGGTWLDIGANDGFLLKSIPRSFTKVACEPSANFIEDLKVYADRVVSDYFSAEAIDSTADIITSAAMFYDVDDPHRFLADISRTLKPDGVWINQLNDSPTMLQANAWDAVCHEHLCYYDLPTLARMYAEHGLGIVGVSSNDVNGGSLRVIAVHGKHTIKIPELAQTIDECQAFADRARKWKSCMTELAQSVFAKEPTWCYGASTKGQVLLQYLDQSHAFQAVADKNTLKHGRYMAGSWVPIQSEEQMRKEKPKYMVVLPWSFKKEFVAREKKAREAGTTLVFPLPSIEFVQ